MSLSNIDFYWSRSRKEHCDGWLLTNCMYVNPTNRNSFTYRNKLGQVIVVSYYTPVAMIDGYCKVHKLWSGWSITTQCHLNAYLHYYNAGHACKRDWEEMPKESAELEPSDEHKV